MAPEEGKEVKKTSPWWRYAEEFFRHVHATDIARIAPGTPWIFDSALRTTCVGPRYEVGEDKIGIPIPGLNYARRGENASTSAPSPTSKDEKKLIGTIPAVPSEPFVMPKLKEHEEGIELVQNLTAHEVGMLVRTFLSLGGDVTQDIAKFVGVSMTELNGWISKHENGLEPEQTVRASSDKQTTSDEVHEMLKVWLRHESASRINAYLDARREAAAKATKKLDRDLIFKDNEPDMAASYGLVNVPSNLTSCSEQGVDGLPSSAGTTKIAGDERTREDMDIDESVDDDEGLDIEEKTMKECAKAFGFDGDLRHFEQGWTDEMIPAHTEILLSRYFKRETGEHGTPSPHDESSHPCSVCAKLKTLSKKCGKSDGSINCVKKSARSSEEIQLPSSVKRVKKNAPADVELCRIEKALREDPRLASCAPCDEVEGEILSLQYELLWRIQANRHILLQAQGNIGNELDADNENHAKRKNILDEAGVYMAGIREMKRQQKKEKREADQLAALERAKAAVGDGRREHKPKRELGSAAAVIQIPKTEIPVYRPPSAQAVMKAIEAAPTRVKKMFGLGKFATESTASQLKSFMSGVVTPRSGSPIIGGSPIRSPMSQILLDPFHAVSDNTACCVCAGTTEAAKMKETIQCAQCELIVHPACYGVGQKTDLEWLCCVCTEVTKAGGGIPKTERKATVTVQGKLALYRGVSCVLCPVKIGAFKRTTDGKDWCHVVCAKWVPEASIREDRVVNAIERVPPESIPRERRNASCSYCTRSEGILMRCRSGYCHNVFHPLCCRRAACHMRVIDCEGRQYTAFCEKHTGAERVKDIDANLIGDPVPALVEMYNQSPKLERQLSGELIRQLSGGNLGPSKGNGSLSRMGKSNSTPTKTAKPELPSSIAKNKAKTRSNLRKSVGLPGSVATSDVANFDDEENF